MNKGRLKCQVLKGMFSDERAVVVDLNNGDKSSVFVPAAEVRGDIGARGEVNVDVFEDDGAFWAVLPTEYRETVPVRKLDVIVT